MNSLEGGTMTKLSYIQLLDENQKLKNKLGALTSVSGDTVRGEIEMQPVVYSSAP